MPELTVEREIWPLAREFKISRGGKKQAEVVVATINEGDHTGRGECVPYARYDETVESVMDAIQSLAPEIRRGMDRVDLQDALPPGAARNALDCALWDYDAKRLGVPVWKLAGLDEPLPVTTSFTLGVDEPKAMGKAAKAESDRPVLKLKLAGEGDLKRVSAVRDNAPDARLIVDVNEGWQADQVEPFSKSLRTLGVRLIEQPLPAGGDSILGDIDHPVLICADESSHDRSNLGEIAARYNYINIKLDKTGGLTEALALRRAAKAEGLGIMVGCMVATSLSMAPAMLVAQGAGFVDLDGPLLLAKDRADGLVYKGSTISPPSSSFWG